MDRCLFLSLVMIGCLSTPATAQTLFDVDETDKVTLGAGSHPAAGADIGRTPPNLFLQHLSLIVAPSPRQHIGPSITNAPTWPGSTAHGFDTLRSGSYPERDGQHAVIGWLRSHGFAVEPRRNPRFPVRFSGTVGQLEEAFRVEIHNYISGGRVYHANASPPSIPRAFAGSIRAVSLQDGPHRNSALNPQGSTETVLYDFTGTPYDAALGGITDKAGNLYGTTPGGGAAGLGAIFKVDTSGNGTFLYSFTAGNGDGISPNPGLSMDSGGNLYGTTFLGGSKNWGTVFKFDPTGHETVLYSFSGGADGGNPMGGVAIDSAGNIYGTTSSGGVTGVCCGAVFKLDPTGQEKLLHSFTGANGDGKFPNGGLIQDSVGNLYGTTSSGGVTNDCCGTVFKVDPAGHETVLYSFLLANQGNDGAYPNGGLILDGAGNIYGTTSSGGGTGVSSGTVFKIDPTGH
jgi:uncharacterized repeat protein (TIGR03803 family)